MEVVGAVRPVAAIPHPIATHHRVPSPLPASSSQLPTFGSPISLSCSAHSEPQSFAFSSSHKKGQAGSRSVQLAKESLSSCRASLQLLQRPALSGGALLAEKSQMPYPGSTRESLHSRKACRPTAQTAPMTPPYNVLITGSTKGIGLALARDFLRSGDNVVVCSRSAERVEETVKELQEEFGEGRVVGAPCDVSKAGDVAQLAEYARSKLGHLDIWINNAGSNAYSYVPLVDSDDQNLAEIVETNTLGVMLCCRQAIRLMREQPRGGHVFNMDGAGADGGATPRFAAYGATKRGLAQFTKSLQAELRMLECRKVVVHNLSPGMVTTELLMSGADTRQAKFFINALAEPAEEVAAYLVPRVREVCAAGRNSSSYIRFLTGPKAYSQILARVLFKARKDRYMAED